MIYGARGRSWRPSAAAAAGSVSWTCVAGDDGEQAASRQAARADSGTRRFMQFPWQVGIVESSNRVKAQVVAKVDHALASAGGG